MKTLTLASEEKEEEEERDQSLDYGTCYGYNYGRVLERNCVRSVERFGVPKPDAPHIVNL